LLVKMNWKRSIVRVGTTILTLAGLSNLTFSEDLLTPAITNALNNQWAVPIGTEAAIRALQTYGNGKNAKAALAILKAGRPQAPTPDPDLYDIAANSLGADFWRLVAGSHITGPSCDAALRVIRRQFDTNKRSLAAAAKAYRDTGEYAGLAILLKYAPDIPSPTPPTLSSLQTQEIYRGCFSLSSQMLFQAVEESIAIKP